MLKNKKIGFCITGSFCSLNNMLKVLGDLNDYHVDIYVFISNSIKEYDTRFYKSSELISKIEKIINKKVIDSLVESEKFGPIIPLDIVLVYPCSGNTLAKIANGINDNAVTMVVKATIRNNKNIVLGVCSNDVLSNSGVNLMKILNTKHFYLVPMYQDDIINKPCSMISDNSLVIQAIVNALNDKQIQPIFNLGNLQ